MPDLFGSGILLIFLLPIFFLFLFYVILSKVIEFFLMNYNLDFFIKNTLKNSTYLIIKLIAVLILVLGLIELYNFGIFSLSYILFPDQFELFKILIIYPLNTVFFMISLINIQRDHYHFLKGAAYFFLIVIVIIIHSLLFFSNQLPNGNVLNILLTISIYAYLFYQVRFNLINFYEA